MTQTSWRRSIGFWAAWHVVGIAGVLALVGFRMGVEPWRFSPAVRFPAAVLVGGYCLGALLLHLGQFLRPKPGFVAVLSGALAGYALAFLVFLVGDLQLSRFAILLASAGGIGLLLLGFATGRFRAILLLVSAVAVAGILVRIASSGAGLPSLPKTHSTVSLATGLYDVRATYYRNYLPRSPSHLTGGGIAALEGDRQLVVTSDGDLLLVRWAAEGSPEVTRLPASLPLNREEFARVAGTGTYVTWFRAFDVLTTVVGDRRGIFVSHHWWRQNEQCFVVQVSLIEGPAAQPIEELVRGAWRTVYETTPCLHLVKSEPGWPFRGMEGGGRMALLGDRLLLTVGDQGYNGVDFETEPDYVQDSTASYGKTLLIDIATGSWHPYTIGHRNPQGLAVDASGRVWETEHGPQGGDELNLLTPGANYGWPRVSYGTEYGKHAWPLNPQQGRHEGYTGPTYAWVPSIGASNLIEVSGGLFSAWRGDLLIGSLVDETLRRLRVVGDGVRLVEPIPLGERVRDLLEDGRGRIVILTDSYSLVTLEPSQESFGVCAGCHNIGGGPGRRLGPDLAGVVGRPIASDTTFEYSPALRALGGTWTEARLDQFLADPPGFAAGTAMAMQAIRDSLTRKAIIAYLRAH